MNKRIVRKSGIELSSRSLKRPIAAALLLLAVIFAFGCSRLNHLTSSHDGSSGSSDHGDAATVERALALNSPRMTKYADLQISVTKGTIIEGDTAGAGSAKATLTLSITNTSNDSVRIKSGLWQLRLGDGAIYKEPFDDVFAARDTQERKLAFSVPSNANWPGAQLVVDEQDKEPAVLPLDGDAPTVPAPTKLTLNGGASLNEPAPVTFTLLAGTLDLDAFGQRAEIGKRYLKMTIHADCKDTRGGGCYVGGDTFRILIDGQPAAPEKLDPVAEAVTSQGSRDFTAAFLVPANAGNLQLEVGEVGKETARVPIDLKTNKS